MFKSKYFTLLLLFFVVPVALADNQVSEQSVKELLDVTNARKLVDDVTGQIDDLMKGSMQQSLKGQSISPKQQKVIDDLQQKTVTLFKEELNWTKLEPLYLKIYRESFTQEEVDGILAFYKTPAGQAVIKKMPMVIQKSNLEMQGRVESLMPKFQKIQQEALTELNALAKSQPATKKK